MRSSRANHLRESLARITCANHLRESLTRITYANHLRESLTRITYANHLRLIAPTQKCTALLVADAMINGNKPGATAFGTTLTRSICPVWPVSGGACGTDALSEWNSSAPTTHCSATLRS